jgi:methionine-R-sulfoxide reductase
LGERGAILEATYSDDSLRERLTPLQYKVTQEEGTEPAFNNEYWDNTEAGIYVDVIDGTPLYSSLDKFDSGTGWPSFTKPISQEAIETETDTRFFMTRTEVISASSDAHLGHIFQDAPAEL